jgi:osmotically-inducible protein OsmY
VDPERWQGFALTVTLAGRWHDLLEARVIKLGCSTVKEASVKTHKALWVVPAVLMSAGALADSSMSMSKQTDKQINDQVMAVFQQHPDLGNSVTSHTKNGVVYITGKVATGLQKTNAEQLAGGVAGVKKVVDNAGTEKGGG